MARMIPSVISQEKQNAAETLVFNYLKNDPFTKDWTVLHSYDLVHVQSRTIGEIDFLILVPGLGCLCLEVKGCSIVTRKEGVWYYGEDQNPDTQGPFKQAAKSTYSLLENLKVKYPELVDEIVLTSAVLFVNSTGAARYECDEWHPWQMITSDSMYYDRLGQDILKALRESKNFLHQTFPNKPAFFPENIKPTPQQCEAIANFLRPDFEMYADPWARFRIAEQEIRRYTEEQIEALDDIDANQRILFNGPAGTGKTFLALEAARRNALTGQKTLFICYNKFLGKWLKHQFEPLGESVTVRTLHEQMHTLCDLFPISPEQRDSQKFWEEDLPRMALKKIRRENMAQMLIVDEAQDILSHRAYLDFLDKSLLGGLENGQWRFFGDFDHQGIYNDGRERISLCKFTKKYNGFLRQLRNNCRNPHGITEFSQSMANMNPGYRKILRDIPYWSEPKFLYYKDPEEELQILESLLNRLTETEGFFWEHIKIISRHGNGHSAAARLAETKSWKDRLVPYDQCGLKQTGYCSIHAFKGLESPVVIVTDVHSGSLEKSRELLYVASTRALQKLIIIAHESEKEGFRSLRYQKPLPEESPTDISPSEPKTH
jgi:superfamily I DNA/RNA helicase